MVEIIEALNNTSGNRVFLYSLIYLASIYLFGMMVKTIVNSISKVIKGWRSGK